MNILFNAVLGFFTGAFLASGFALLSQEHMLGVVLVVLSAMCAIILLAGRD